MLRKISHNVKCTPFVIFKWKCVTEIFNVSFFLSSWSVLCWGVWETSCPPVQWKTWTLKWLTFVLWSLCVHFFRPTCRLSQRWLERVPGSSTTSQVWTVCLSHTWSLLNLKHILLHWYWDFCLMYSLGYLAQGPAWFRDSSYQQTLLRT